MDFWYNTAFSLYRQSMFGQIVKESAYLINQLLLKKWVTENVRNLTLICLKVEVYFQLLKFIYSEKATKFCEISTVDLTITT